MALHFGKILRSLPLRGAWIETYILRLTAIVVKSLPLRGAWIETATGKDQVTIGLVAPLAGGVD